MAGAGVIHVPPVSPDISSALNALFMSAQSSKTIFGDARVTG
jgi:hypothetical protein